MTLRVLTESGTIWRGIGLNDAGENVFTLGQTMPTAENTGVEVGQPLVNHALYATPGEVIFDTAGQVIEGINFGTRRVRVRAANVTIRNCRFVITGLEDDGEYAVINANNAAVSGLKIEHCDIINTYQGGHKLLGVWGHNFDLYRCKILGTVDGVRPNIAGNWSIRGCFISELGWWAAPSNGIVHGSDVQSHSDCIQTTFGGGSIVGSSLFAYPSLVVGTGTPTSGSDAGNSSPSGWYTQAQAIARRAELMGSSWTMASKSYGGVSRENGGVITPLMLNISTGSTAPSVTVTDSWFAGGTLQVNALAANLTSPVGVFMRNRHFDDSRYTVAGRAMGYRFRNGLTGTVPQSGANRNVFMNDGATVPLIDA